jgi:hypothetical protein
MTYAQKYIVWAIGILLWVFGLSVLLSYISFGYLDFETVGHMAGIVSPLLVVAAILFSHFRQSVDVAGRKRVARAAWGMKEQTR